MPGKRWDETWHRLRVWTNGQTASERLAAQVLLAEGYLNLDPIHPRGGPDEGKDAIAMKDGQRWVMAVYFPGEQRTITKLKAKVLSDYDGGAANHGHGLVFVCNQELSLSERAEIIASVPGPLELYHLERTTSVLDQARMGPVRRQLALEDETVYRIESLQTGGDTYAYFMLYHFDLSLGIARSLCVIRVGEFPLYDLRFRVYDLESGNDVFHWPSSELNSPADYLIGEWALADDVYYRIFFNARNGSCYQDLQLKKSPTASCWLAATRVQKMQQIPDFQHCDREFSEEFGEPVWRQ